MCSPNRSPQQLIHHGGRRTSMKHGEILNVLRNSAKGQLHYDTGWDEKPYAVAQLISKAQADEDSIKIAIMQRAIKAEKLSEMKQALRESELSPMGTNSGSGSRVTLSDNGNHCRRCTNNNSYHNNSIEEDVSDAKSVKPKRKGYGIREDEYDDEAMEREFQMQQHADQHNHVEACIKQYNVSLHKIAEENSRKQKDKINRELNEGLEKLNITFKDSETKRQANLMKQRLRNKELEAQVMAEVEAKERIRKSENDALDLEFELKKTHRREQKARENAAVQARAAAAKAAEERDRLLKIQQENDAAAEAAEAAIKQKVIDDAARDQEEKLAQEAEAAAALVRATQEADAVKQKQPLLSFPSALQGYILKDDCDKYVRCSNLIIKCEQDTTDITAASENPIIKKFYSGASKCINTPLNAVANTDPGQINAKINHFVDMIEGKPVFASSTMTVPFNSTTLPNGKLFVIRLLAFRFVKKAESEILSEKKGFIPLAEIGFSLSKRFPEWGSLVQAYFYKLCPFLVPFNFPRGTLTLQEYCNNLGYDLKGSDSTLLNEMLGRVKGYCSLYAIMVQTFERNPAFDMGEALSFFTIGGVWEILTKTMKLDPQPDVTVMIFHTLLDLLSDRLNQVYGAQYHKLMNVMISVYLHKINAVSSGASKSGVVRFTTFLEQQFRRQ